MILYSRPTVEKFFNEHCDTFKEIVSARHDFDDTEAIEKLRLSYQQFENDLNRIPEHKIINRNAHLASWIYKIQHGYKSSTMSYDNIVYTNHGLADKVYRYCKEYITVFNLDLDNHSIDIDDDILMLNVSEREAIDIEAQHKKDILDIKEIVHEELDTDYSFTINNIKKAVKILNENPQPNLDDPNIFDDPKIMNVLSYAVGSCVRIMLNTTCDKFVK